MVASLLEIKKSPLNNHGNAYCVLRRIALGVEDKRDPPDAPLQSEETSVFFGGDSPVSGVPSAAPSERAGIMPCCKTPFVIIAVSPQTLAGPAVNAGTRPRAPRSSTTRKAGSSSSLTESVKTLSTWESAETGTWDGRKASECCEYRLRRPSLVWLTGPLPHLSWPLGSPVLLESAGNIHASLHTVVVPRISGPTLPYSFPLVVATQRPIETF